MYLIKISRVLLTFGVLINLNSTVSIEIISKSLIDDEKLSKSICKIANDVARSKTGTQDILIGNFGFQVWTSTTNDIVRCIDDETAVVVADFKEIIKSKRLRKASTVILPLGYVDKVSFSRIYFGKNQEGRTDKMPFDRFCFFGEYISPKSCNNNFL